MAKRDNDIKIVGLDTETYKGSAYLMTTADSYIVSHTRKDFLDFAYHNGGDINFFYNLDFDVRAFLVKYLRLEDVKRLYYTGKINVDGYRIVYLRTKVLKLNGKSYYDLAQFYNYLSLDNASKRYLNLDKKNPGINWTTVTWKELKSKLKLIIDYSKYDSYLCQQLGTLLYRMTCQVSGQDFRTFYSIAYLTKKLILHKYPVFKVDSKYNDYLKSFYFGGRVETFKKGYFSRAYVYDINSCYPSCVAELPDLTGAKIYFARNRGGDISFMTALVSFKPGFYFYPLAYKNGSLNLYPYTKNHIFYINSYEYEAYKKYFRDFRVIRSLNIKLRSSKYKPFKSDVTRYYNERKKSEAHNFILKIALNSLYGCFAESIPKNKLLNFGEALTEYYINCNAIYENRLRMRFRLCRDKNCYACPESSYCYRFNRYRRAYNRFKIRTKPVRYIYDRDFVLVGKAQEGRYYNLIYACLVTSLARIKLFKFMEMVDPSLLVATYTDSVTLTQEVNNKYIGDSLGQFSLKVRAINYYQIGNGVYQYDYINKEGLNKTVIKFRGISYAKRLTEIFNKNRSLVYVPSRVVISEGLIESQSNRYTLADLNDFKIISKKYNINIDNKRDFPKITKAMALLLCQVDSYPKEI